MSNHGNSNRLKVYNALNVDGTTSQETVQHLVKSVLFGKKHNFANMCWSKQALMRLKQMKQSSHGKPQAE